MRIAIDISPIVYGTGVSVYTRELVKSLLSEDDMNEYVLLGMSLRRQSEIRSFMSQFSSGSVARVVKPIPPTLADVLFNTLRWPTAESLVGSCNVFHSSDWTQPRSKAFKVTTIHDMSPITHPEFTPKKVVDVHKRRLARVKAEVDRVIVPSLATQEEVVSFGVDASKVVVIPEAVSENFKKAGDGDIQKVKEKYGLANYILSVGTNPRKNTKRIIEAFTEVAKSNKELKLVVVGNKNPDLSETPGVVYTGFISDEELVALYSGSMGLIYASIHEGFGLSILQAFACECPVVTSSLSSMPEVAGSAAIYVDPHNVESIVYGINKVIKEGRGYTTLGLERVKEFSWKKMAQDTLEVYKEAERV